MMQKPPEQTTETAKIVARILSDYGFGVSSPDDGTLDDVEQERWNACVDIARAIGQIAWRAAVQRCIAEVTGIWGADLVTTQAALDDLLECRPE